MSITTVEAAGLFGAAVAQAASRDAIIVVTARTADFVKAGGDEERSAFVDGATAQAVEPVASIAFGVLDPTETYAVFHTNVGVVRLEWADKPEDEDIVLYDIYESTGLEVPDVPDAPAQATLFDPDAEEVSLDSL